MFNTVHNSFPFRANQIAKVKDNIPEPKLVVNKSVVLTSVNAGATTIVASHAAERFVNNPDKTSNVGPFRNNFIRNIYSITFVVLPSVTIFIEPTLSVLLYSTPNFLSNDKTDGWGW